MKLPSLTRTGPLGAPHARRAMLIGVLLLATLTALAWVQWRQLALVDEAFRYADDNVEWRFFQLETSYLQLDEGLRHAIADPGPAALAALRERYEIFVSRVQLIDPERINAAVSRRSEHLQAYQQLQAYVRKQS